jgi:predicted glycogen debranching enzyme
VPAVSAEEAAGQAVTAFGPEQWPDFAHGASKEWLETNGLGGYASSTVIGANTRRYHGLLVAALKPPGQRTVLLSKLEETLAVRDVEYDLSCNQYPGVVHPEGYRYLREFRLDPFPTSLYEAGRGITTRLERSVVMLYGRNTVVIRYRMLSCPGTVSLIVRPIVNCRDYHHLTRETPAFDTTADISGGRDVVVMKPYADGPTLFLSFPGAYFEAWGDWYHNFEYPEEAARGLDAREDQYSPGLFTCQFVAGETRYLIASTEPVENLNAAASVEAERRRRARLPSSWEGASDAALRTSEPSLRSTSGVQVLVAAADTFLVRRRHEEDGGAYSVVAGYHWFEEWGRDAMISLPGLTLVTRRFDVARSVLRSFSAHCSQGMIPNRIPEPGVEPDYNTADATLWMFWAAHKYLDCTDDHDFVGDELLPVFREIIEWHVKGTRYGISADEDGLLRAGSPETQLTWMDAKVGDWVVTPRHGKPVEINALWHHALRFLEELGVAHSGPSADLVREQFQRRFWNERAGYLNDVVDGEQREDASLRPNQIIAASLPYPLLNPEQARQVVTVVKQHLLTPYGLRTLSPHDPRYRGVYAGDQRARDGAYHQGTVWPWLLGPLITAHLKVAEDKAAARAEAAGWLGPLWAHLQDAGLGQISEIFDGDPPHRPRGCIAQAWSVAEVLRAAVEDIGFGLPRSPRL